MRAALILVLLSGLLAPVAYAQQERLPPGVELETRYSRAGRPILAIRPFAGPPPVAEFVRQAEDIVRNDLALSNRFEMLPTPSDLAEGPVAYDRWNSLRVTYLLDGAVQVTTSGYQIAITVHDVPYATVKRTANFALPETGSPDFRMAVHAVSDEIVQWITDQPGIAATRIAFVRKNGGLSYDLLLVDSDGQNLRRIQGSQRQIYSPTWSPDGGRLAYTRATTEGWQLVERDLLTGREHVIASGKLVQTPAYIPNSSRLGFAMYLGEGRYAGLELFEVDTHGGSPTKITDSPGDNLSPTYSPDGRQLAFHSSRTGRQHIYVMPAGGGSPRLLSPIGERVEYSAPDWSPVGTRVAFHGQSRGTFQLMLADAARPGAQIQQLTSSGRNEDPSWAPDGRHIVYTGVGAEGRGLYVIDIVTGEIRQLVKGDELRIADWSPSLAARTGVAASSR